MARKAYSEQEREQVRNALLTTVLRCIVDRRLLHSSIGVLCKKVGISKTFFYTLFPSKTEKGRFPETGCWFCAAFCPASVCPCDSAAWGFFTI